MLEGDIFGRTVVVIEYPSHMHIPSVNSFDSLVVAPLCRVLDERDARGRRCRRSVLPTGAAGPDAVASNLRRT